MKKEKWVWMPHAGHFISANRCQFKLNTYVGKYIVSTVGELPKTGIDYAYDKPDNDPYMNQFAEIGAGRKYETMVFKARKSKHKCCHYEIIVSDEVDLKAYNTADDAYAGHLELCDKWSS